jgi:hypothetical protein
MLLSMNKDMNHHIIIAASKALVHLLHVSTMRHNFCALGHTQCMGVWEGQQAHANRLQDVFRKTIFRSLGMSKEPMYALRFER